MILKINNTERHFYEVMGKYFADRSFIKELDSQLYDNNCEWYIEVTPETRIIRGFASIENKGKYYYLDNFYVFEADRGQGIGSEIIETILKDYDNIKLISRNEAAIHIFKKMGFVEYGKNGRYKKLVFQKENN